MDLVGLKEKINSDGYAIVDLFSKADFDLIQTSISLSYFNRIKSSSEYSGSGQVFDIGKHHLHQGFDCHALFQDKQARTLCLDMSYRIMAMGAIKNLLKELGSTRISDEQCLGYPNFVWRLVRPLRQSDIGPIHRDEWFWITDRERLNRKDLEYKERTKVWIPIEVEKGLNGLLIERFSHLRNDIEWFQELRDGRAKPGIGNSQMNQLNLELLELDLGQAVIFHDKLIHGGKINEGSKTRVSLEFTILS